MAEKMVKMLIKNPKATSRWFGRSKVGTEVMIPEDAAERLKQLGDVVYAPVEEAQPEAPREEEAPPEQPAGRPVSAMSLEGAWGNFSGDRTDGQPTDTPSSTQSGEEEPLS